MREMDTTELRRILLAFGVSPHRTRSLQGGYSSTNFLVETHTKAYVLKVIQSYSLASVQSQMRLVARLLDAGMRQIPVPVPCQGQGYVYSCSDCIACLFEYVDGTTAETLIGTDAKEAVAAGAGKALARLHVMRIDFSNLRHVEDGGACDLGLHLSGSMQDKIRGSTVAQHPYALFYIQHASSIVSRCCLDSLPRGALHGDPFLDNMVVDPDTLEVKALIDTEDMAIGPFLFDIACCLSDLCVTCDSFQMTRLDAFLQGYCSVRSLTALEKTLLVDCMHLALLCNCTWRFVHFNLDHPELQESRNAYVELYERLLFLMSDCAQHTLQQQLKQCIG